MKRFSLLLAVLLLALAPSYAQLTGFSKYKEITISHANVDADLTNFPLYVAIDADTDIGAICQADGDDVQFANSDNTAALTFERLPGFAVAAGAASGDFFILVPTVAGASDTTIRCYYGNAGSTSASSAANTFATANGWVAVWHLEESGENYADATGVNNSDGTGTAPTQATGRDAKGQDFEDGSSQWINVPDSNSLDLGTGDFTITAWAKAESINGADGNYAMAHRAWGSGAGWLLRIDRFSEAAGAIYDGTDLQTVSSEGTLTPGTWAHIGIRCDRDSATGFRAILNGAANGNATDPTAVGDLTAARAVGIGTRDAGDGGVYYDGVLDELRISNTLRSDAWIKFEEANMDDGHDADAGDNELTWGAEQSAGSAYIPRVIIIQ